MDQLKVFLKQAVKYRFWIAFGISLLLPIIGYFVGSGAINAETTKREAEIKGANTEVVKYTTPGIVNGQYQPLAATKKEALVQDVDSTWRKLFATQEPLLKWPPEVQERFRKWGRKYPEGVDPNQIRSTLIDYTVAYPEFVDKIYKIVKPFNFDDGSGIVVAPEPKALLGTAEFKQESPPDLTKVWAEQERLWVVTALLDAIAKVNESVAAKDWDGAIVKQINLLEVGSSKDQDQKSIAKNELLAPPDPLNDPKATTPPPAPASPTPGGSMDMGGGGKAAEVMYLKTDSLQFKALPIKLTVLVDQSRLPNYLVGLENSPMSIEVNEVEIAKPLTPVSKPAYGERSSFNAGMSGGGEGPGPGGPGSMARSMAGGGMRPGGMGGPGLMAGGGGSEIPGIGRGMGPGGGGGAAGKTAGNGAVDNRTKNDAKARQERIKKELEAAKKAKAETKKIDQYYNVIEVTVYGRARFYMAPPAAPAPPPSMAGPAPAPASEAPKPEPAPAQPPVAPDAPKKDEAPKAETPKVEPAAPGPEAPKADAPKTDTPAPKP
jgi:hypothetical protein